MGVGENLNLLKCNKKIITSNYITSIINGFFIVFVACSKAENTDAMSDNKGWYGISQLELRYSGAIWKQAILSTQLISMHRSF